MEVALFCCAVVSDERRFMKCVLANVKPRGSHSSLADGKPGFCTRSEKTTWTVSQLFESWSRIRGVGNHNCHSYGRFTYLRTKRRKWLHELETTLEPFATTSCHGDIEIFVFLRSDARSSAEFKFCRCVANNLNDKPITDRGDGGCAHQGKGGDDGRSANMARKKEGLSLSFRLLFLRTSIQLFVEFYGGRSEVSFLPQCSGGLNGGDTPGSTYIRIWFQIRIWICRCPLFAEIKSGSWFFMGCWLQPTDILASVCARSCQSSSSSRSQGSARTLLQLTRMTQVLLHQA